jgi:Protein of unknown function (DUF1553)/Protein of unknown function (DUF1549)/Concanavalin A-like lectin/glucanases superfamily/Planctomycete cytochrome C
MRSLRRAGFGLLLSLTVISAARAQTTIEYNRDVRPILAENCFACHGPDSASRKAGLRLDQREAAIKKKAFKPGNAKDSELISRITSSDVEKIMPPPKAHKKLTQAQKDTLTRWIAEGAEYQSHWSLIAPKRPELPKVKNETWVRNPIDRFILAELEKRGLKPAPEADRRTLARRLSLDLIGLPPIPAEVEAFVNDKSPDAYEKFVDHLMKSPHWGEHRARYWLDAARYADTHGIHFDNFREIHAYRDWVINAFNKNQRFDQFTIEQIAGDLLPKPTMDQLIATGFNRCNITSNEGGLIPEEYLVMYTRDRTETVAAVWLGMTMNCCTCHDHKFDPISQKDFYAMSAFFNNTTQGAMDGNISNTPPIIFVPKSEDRARWDALAKDLAELRGKIAERKKDAQGEFDDWVSQANADDVAAMIPTDKLTLHARLNEAQGKTASFTIAGRPRDAELKDGYDWIAGKGTPKTFTIKPSGNSIEFADVGDFEKDQGFSIGGWVKLARRGNTGAIAARMDNPPQHRGWDFWMENDKVGMHIINDWPGNALKVTSKTPLQPGQWQHVLVTYDGSSKAAGVKVYINGVAQMLDVFTDKLSASIKSAVPFKVGQRHASERLKDTSLQDLRIYDRTLKSSEAMQLAKSSKAADFLAKPADKRTPQERNELFDWWLAAVDAPYRTLNEKVAGVQQEEATMKSRGTTAHVMSERKDEPTAYILFRGDYDKRRAQVKAATPSALPPMPAELPRNRLGFAQWLLRPEHPLTTRVTVNRFWQEIYGNGLVKSSGDFGIMGEMPTHPELLDWLAVEFMSPASLPRERGEEWDIKRFFKLMVTSATYRQSSNVTKESLEKDRDNRWLSRAPRYRMDAEMIRDYALASSGILVRKIGGPSVKPYMPDGVWEAVGMIGSNTRDYRRDTGEKLYRRSMYTFWKRAAPPASMDILNAPNRETCTTRRDRTNTPLQALVTLNDVQFIEAARFLAQTALKDGGTTEANKIDFIARRLLARPFRDAELKVVQESLADLQAHYKTRLEEARKLINVGESRPDAAIDPGTLAAWTMLVNELMNLDEVLNK